MYDITYPVVCPNAGFPNENVEDWLLKSELADVTAVVVSGAPKVDVWEKNPPDVGKVDAEVGCPKNDVWVTEAEAGWPKGVLCAKVVEGWANKFVCATVVEGGWPKSDVCDTVVTGVRPKVVTWGTVVDAGCCPKGVWVVGVSHEAVTSVFELVKKDEVSDCAGTVISVEDVVTDTSAWEVLETSEETVDIDTVCPNKAVDEEGGAWRGCADNGGGGGGLDNEKFDNEVVVSVVATDETAEMVVGGIVFTTESISEVEDELFIGSDGVTDKEIGCFNSLKSELLTFFSLLASSKLSVFKERFSPVWLIEVLELSDLFADVNESTRMLCSLLHGDWVTGTVLLTEPKVRLKVSPEKKLDLAVLSSFIGCCSVLLDPKRNPVLVFRGWVAERFPLPWVLGESFVSVVISSGADTEVFTTDTIGFALLFVDT